MFNNFDLQISLLSFAKPQNLHKSFLAHFFIATKFGRSDLQPSRPSRGRRFGRKAPIGSYRTLIVVESEYHKNTQCTTLKLALLSTNILGVGEEEEMDN